YGRCGAKGTGEPRRQMLHARALGFPHPRSGELIAAESPVPQDFAATLAILRGGKKNAPAMPARARTKRNRAARRER
ncbi:MAG TPA: RluA family pseudouridine synthase, partial [Thermoanaerobaculia bacterium]